VSHAELVERLADLVSEHDKEAARQEAEDLLLEYIGDADVTEAFRAILTPARERGWWYQQRRYQRRRQLA
jgi:uncharacterized protein YndB with AHSA1/START domain